MLRARAFTLVEMLIVTVIICLLAALLYPVLSGARRAALATEGISNMRQIAVAISLYSDQNGGVLGAPPFDVATGLVPAALTCDPLDTWRASCAQSNGAPMLGSYGYVPEILLCCYPANTQQCTDIEASCPDPPMLVDPFGLENPTCQWYAGTGIDPDRAWLAACLAKRGMVTLGPSKYVRADTSVATFRWGGNYPAGWPTWLIVYYNRCLRQGGVSGSGTGG